jgi:hypothetical protein
MSDTEILIDKNNFEEYFFDVRRFKPKRGQTMARYMATAEFIDGMMKKNIIDLLHKDKAEAAVSVMRKLGCATEGDSIKVVRAVCDDLVSGMSIDDVEKKVYRYTLEAFYYTQKEHIPTDDPHWSPVNVRNMDDFMDAANRKCKMTAKIVDNLDGEKQGE